MKTITITEEEYNHLIEENKRLSDFYSKWINVGETTIISKKEYEHLLERSEKLSKLEMAGVDNWCNYEYAMKGEWD